MIRQRVALPALSEWALSWRAVRRAWHHLLAVGAVACLT